MYQTRLYHEDTLRKAVVVLHTLHPGNTVAVVPVAISNSELVMYRAQVNDEILVTLIEAYAKLIMERKAKDGN